MVFQRGRITMPERKFANSYEMDINKMYDAIMYWFCTHENVETFNKEDDERMNALEERINNIMGLDEKFKLSFIGDMQRTIVDASFNGFENGFKIGLSLLHNLLTAELPEIHIVRHEPDRTERRCPPVCQDTNTKQIFIDYVNKYCMFLSKEQICSIQGRMEQLITDNFKRLVNDLF